jgi:hypothetical protein
MNWFSNGKYDFVFVPVSASIEKATGPSLSVIVNVPCIVPQFPVEHTFTFQVQ